MGGCHSFPLLREGTPGGQTGSRTSQRVRAQPTWLTVWICTTIAPCRLLSARRENGSYGHHRGRTRSILFGRLPDFVSSFSVAGESCASAFLVLCQMANLASLQSGSPRREETSSISPSAPAIRSRRYLNVG